MADPSFVLNSIQATHHQIGNSLQSVLSLLEIGARENTPEARPALLEASRWIRVVMRLHRRLQVAVDDAVRFDELASEIVGDLAELQAIEHFTFRSDVVIAPSGAARTLALVLAELAANAFEHGKAEAGKPVMIDIAQTGTEIRLSVRNALRTDAGGFNGFGLQTVRCLMKALGGAVEAVASQTEVTVVASAPSTVVWRRADLT